jgi:hypothetical protein
MQPPQPAAGSNGIQLPHMRLQFLPLLPIGGCRDCGGNNSVEVGGGDNNGSDNSDRLSGDDDSNSDSGCDDAVATVMAAGIDNNQLKVVTTTSTAATTR